VTRRAHVGEAHRRRHVLASRAGFEPVRAALAKTHALFEVRGADPGAEWTPVGPDASFEWDHVRPLASSKRFFFPPSETILAWRGDDATAVEHAPAPFVLVGLHPCDLAAIAYQDRFFADDPWYQARRRQAILVGLDCAAACPGGFCREVGTGPFAHAPFDLDLTPLPDGRVVIEAGSDAGAAVLAAAGVPPAPLDADDLHAYEAARAAAEASFPPRPFVARAIARIDAGAVADAEWQALGPACFTCTGCTNLCPTCSCFTTVDEISDGGGRRVRVWDSCLLEGFQREASGHHPAPRPGDRVRRFWTHKLAAAFADGFDGRLGCVGCGRCDVTCPGSIGALPVLSALGER